METTAQTTTTLETTMRAQMGRTVQDLMAHDERLAVLLADISRPFFAEAFARYPDRTLNLGIQEQTQVSVGAGFALEGYIPVMHSIAPFLVERAFEQIKDDFCFQRLGGNFITIGASHDYSTEGMTHHAPGDVQILRSLPGMRIVVPGAPGEFDRLFREAYADAAPTYYRLSDQRNSDEHPVRFGHAEIVKRGAQATVIAVGPMLERTQAAVSDLDVTLLYYTTLVPFDGETLRAVCANGKVALVEPFYAGTLTPEVSAALAPLPARIEAIGIPREVPLRYGTPEQHDEALGLTPQGIHARIVRFLAE
ncbi:MAG TPA: transketolase C-terminal domain-containing protein [Ktedonobacterales bacterium]|nr:transketolase C-terminal domain-containing protein [Ktedonobacterales bacterium]